MVKWVGEIWLVIRCHMQVILNSRHSPTNPNSFMNQGNQEILSRVQLGQVECLRSEDTPPTHPPPPHDYPYYWFILDPKIKTRQSQNYKFNEFGKTSNLKMLDKMCKYEMDLASIVEDTERTRFCWQTNRRTDGQMDMVKPVYPPSTSLSGGYKNIKLCYQGNKCGGVRICDEGDEWRLSTYASQGCKGLNLTDY